MRWFGVGAWAPICDDCERVDVPVGERCAYCSQIIEPGDDGLMIPHHDAGGVRELPWHRECQLRTVIGGLNHLRGQCQCCGGSEPPDPPWLNKRQAAVLAVYEWEGQQRATR